MKVAVIGTRGIPALHGGIEHHCENLYTKLLNFGYKITIFSRKKYNTQNLKDYRGIKLENIDVPEWKFLETPLYSLLSVLKILKNDYDIVHFHAQGPCMFAYILKLLKPQTKLVFTCHGIDWQRDKWSLFAKLAILLGEYQSVVNFDAHIMVSKYLRDYYKHTYELSSIVIPNGRDIKEAQKNGFKKFNLEKQSYLIFVGRLVPEKNIKGLIEIFKKTDTNLKLVIAGGCAGCDEYTKELCDLAKDDKRIIFTSYIYGKDLEEAYANAYAYISLSFLEGLPITLLEAISYEIPVILSNIKPHTEVIGENQECGFLIQNDNYKKLEEILTLDYKVLEQKASKALKILKENYSWNKAADKTNKIYQSLSI